MKPSTKIFLFGILIISGLLQVTSGQDEEPAVEEPAVEEPAVEEPIVEEPVEEPTVEEPAVEEPAVEEPAVEEPAEEAAPIAEEVITEPEPTPEPEVEETEATPNITIVPSGRAAVVAMPMLGESRELEMMNHTEANITAANITAEHNTTEPMDVNVISLDVNTTVAPHETHHVHHEHVEEEAAPATIMCYECDSFDEDGGDACLDTFDKANTNVPLMECTRPENATTGPRCFKTEHKMTEHMTDKEYIILRRGCNPTGTKLGCEHDDAPADGVTIECYCSDTECNSVSTIAPNMMSILLLIPCVFLYL